MNNDEIIVIEKPDEISFEDIYRVLWEPLDDCNKDCATFVSELKNGLGETGTCFVALHNDEIIGTISVQFIYSDTWYLKGLTAYYMYARVSPIWQGNHINSMLTQKVFKYAEINGCVAVELSTGANNKHAIAVYRHYGFIALRFYRPKNRGFSIEMVKYFKDNPFNIRLYMSNLSINFILHFYRAIRDIYHLLSRFVYTIKNICL